MDLYEVLISFKRSEARIFRLAFAVRGKNAKVF